MAPRIDLHTHSAHSDGTDDVAELLGAAVAAGLDTVALTDHDTTGGWDEAAALLAAGRAPGLQLVRGIEVSCQLGARSIHLLAYLPDPAAPLLAGELDRSRDSRHGRARRMTALLAEVYPITWADVLAQVAGEGTVVGRPHLADALVARGVVPDRSAAFDEILASGSPFYVSHYAPAPEVAIAAVRAAGGVPVVAHPGSSGRGGGPLEDAVLESMIEAGLAGVEAGHRENGAAEQKRLRALAAAHDLIVTGASDYHGAGKQNQLGEHLTAPDQLVRILERATSGIPVLTGAG